MKLLLILDNSKKYSIELIKCCTVGYLLIVLTNKSGCSYTFSSTILVLKFGNYLINVCSVEWKINWQNGKFEYCCPHQNPILFVLTNAPNIQSGFTEHKPLSIQRIVFIYLLKKYIATLSGIPKLFWERDS